MRTLVDIGSMKGEEVLWGIQNGYEVHAFEPNPNMKQFLQVHEPYAVINYAAAWDTDGIAKLHLMFNPEPGEDGLSLIAEKANNSKERFIEVPSVNIGKYLAKLDKDIDILKINAEGAEYVIIQSILENFDYKRIKHWLVEDHSNYIADEGWRKQRRDVLKLAEKVGINIKDYVMVESLIRTHELLEQHI